MSHPISHADAPHDLICNGQVLALKDGENPGSMELFTKFHQKGNAVLVYGVKDVIHESLWTPDSFSKHFGGFKITDIFRSTYAILYLMVRLLWFKVIQLLNADFAN